MRSPGASQMRNPSRTIRLFLSSTFSDMQSERDLMQRRVFPRLRAHSATLGFCFQAIDLRWGVSEEAGRHNRTMRICVEELHRCQQGGVRPNFLVLLGSRYGWRPPPEVIPSDLFLRLRSDVASRSREHAKLLDQIYIADENAVPSTHMLLPRVVPFDDPNSWSSDVEAPLLALLEEAATQLGWRRKRRRSG